MFILQSTTLPALNEAVSFGENGCSKNWENNLAQAVRIYESVFRQRGTLSRGHDGWAGAGYHGNPLPPAHTPAWQSALDYGSESYDVAYPTITDSLANLLHTCSGRCRSDFMQTVHICSFTSGGS